METSQITNAPPDWTIDQKDLLCPLCEYNLRGLAESRCPECGFKFTWQELLDAEKNRHKYLFEHASKGIFGAFWRTYWRTCWPSRFWKDVNPAQPVALLLLITYWGLGCCLCGLFLCLPYIAESALDLIMMEPDGSARMYFYHRYHPSDFAWQWLRIFIAWPWLTLISLLVFRLSMRQAKIRTVHLLRTVIYSCDFGFLFATAAVVLVYSNQLHIAQAWRLLTAAAICSAVTSYRLTIAFEKYLRVHLPFATVLVSQIIAFLIVFVYLAQVADFGRRI